MREPLSQPEHRDEMVEPVGVGALAGQGERQRDVFGGGQRRDEFEGLEHEPEPVAAQQRALPLGEGRQVDVVEQHLAGVDGVEAGKGVDEGRLSRPRWTHNGGETAGGDGDSCDIEGTDRSVPAAVHLDDVAGLGDHRPPGW